MENDEKQRRCAFCHKLLLDEKVHICRRCRLEVRNKGVRIGKMAGGVIVMVGGAFALMDNNSDEDDDTIE